MKKIFSLVALLLVFCLVMAGCENDPPSDNNSSPSNNNSSPSDNNSSSTIEKPAPVDFTGVAPAPAGDFEYLNYPNEGVYILKYLGDDEIVVIPDTIEDAPIISVCFGSCRSLKGVKIPEGAMFIYDRAFYNCNNLTTVELPSTIDTISGEAFRGTNLTYISFPEGLKLIKGQAFQSTNLTNVVIPSSVTAIWVSAFSRCRYLSEFTILDGTNKLSMSDTVLEHVENCVCTIPDRVTEFGENTFGENPTIICTAGSAAEQYAKENGLTYQSN